MAINSRSKGKRGEKQAINFLKKWTGHEFASTPSSGGLRWSKAENISGDVVCISKNYLFPLGIEVKFNKEINFQHLLYEATKKKSCRIKEFWDQCCNDAQRAEKIPMLLMRYNGMASDFFFVVMSKSLFDLIAYEQSKEITPYLKFSKGIVITTTAGISKFKFKVVEEAAWTLIGNSYGKVSK